MSSLRILGTLAVLPLCLCLLGSGDPEPGALALDGLDPVALVAGKKLPGDPERTLRHGGFTYRFASDANRATFERDPERHAIQLDGRCGAMPQAKGDPARFAVHEGQIYIFGSDGCRESFLADPQSHLDKHEKAQP